MDYSNTFKANGSNQIVFMHIRDMYHVYVYLYTRIPFQAYTVSYRGYIFYL